MKIDIETVAHRDQRYDTVGDWMTAKFRDVLHITVSEMPDWRYEALVAVHELCEALICRHEGISQETVDKWDMGEGSVLDEPGESPEAPYYHAHKWASEIEKTLATALDVVWDEYGKACENAGKDETT